MKRIVPLLLSLLLLAGCVGVAAPLSPLVREAAGATAAPSATEDRPQVTGPFLTYRFFEQPGWGELYSATMFEADLDQNGTAEPVSFTRDEDEDVTVIAWGESAVTLEEGSEFVEAAVLDLDTRSPFYNLLVVVDYGSDSYVTVELHPENGRLVQGPRVSGSWTWADDALWFYELTDFLGTAFGMRTYRGDGLTPDSEWLTLSYIPSAEELIDEREDLIDSGVLLHTLLPVPCTVDGQPALIPADTYVYRTRFRADDELTEVCLPDGTLALIAGAVGEHGWPFLIDGRDMLDYFDNVFFAD